MAAGAAARRRSRVGRCGCDEAVARRCRCASPPLGVLSQALWGRGFKRGALVFHRLIEPTAPMAMWSFFVRCMCLFCRQALVFGVPAEDPHGSARICKRRFAPQAPRGLSAPVECFRAGRISQRSTLFEPGKAPSCWLCPHEAPLPFVACLAKSCLRSACHGSILRFGIVRIGRG